MLAGISRKKPPFRKVATNFGNDGVYWVPFPRPALPGSPGMTVGECFAHAAMNSFHLETM